MKSCVILTILDLHFFLSSPPLLFYPTTGWLLRWALQVFDTTVHSHLFSPTPTRGLLLIAKLFLFHWLLRCQSYAFSLFLSSSSIALPILENRLLQYIGLNSSLLRRMKTASLPCHHPIKQILRGCEQVKLWAYHLLQSRYRINCF